MVPLAIASARDQEYVVVQSEIESSALAAVVS